MKGNDLLYETLIKSIKESSGGGGGGEGTVKSVNGIEPDSNGDVKLDVVDEEIEGVFLWSYIIKFIK